MHEASKSIRRRGTETNSKLFKGSGIDIGAGPDCISQWGFNAYNWDLKDGDAQYMASVKDNTYDFVHSAHCLEHMVDPEISLKNWVRICKPGGYIVVVIPEEDMYEHGYWPSRFNSDHKWSFKIFKGTKLHSKSVNVTELLRLIWKDTEIISITRLEDKFDPELNKSYDQTGPVDGPECAIEFILRKK
jgi:2-polyprenyl-3-methyl-5-hydroxy-6-metoxy-1,4-benzoquinol methylase